MGKKTTILECINTFRVDGQEDDYSGMCNWRLGFVQPKGELHNKQMMDYLFILLPSLFKHQFIYF
jgi:hypothetical protein